MPKRKKYPKLPNGYGSIKYLGKGRRNPYAVHPPTTEFNINGSPATPKALCYVNDWYIGFAVLTAYKAGTYFPGYEKTLSANQDSQTALSTLTQRLIADVNRITGAQKDESGKTFAEVYEDFFKWKFERDKSKKYSVSTLRSTRAAFNNCKSVHDKIFNELRHDDLQKVIDSCPLKHSSLELIVNLFKQMYAYAEIYELVDKNYAAHIKINIADDDEHGVPFSNEDLKKLWQIKNNPTAEFLLIACYSGWRISEFDTLEVNLDKLYFKGGLKTAAGRNRIVPIHSAILPLVIHRITSSGHIGVQSKIKFRSDVRKLLPSLGITADHTPHDCRHTFSRLCEDFKVSENDRKRMLGHSFGQDITNQVYGHRSADDLREEIEKIKCY